MTRTQAVLLDISTRIYCARRQGRENVSQQKEESLFTNAVNDAARLIAAIKDTDIEHLEDSPIVQGH